MKVKVSEATGPVLDWMVAAAEGASDLVFDGITWGFWLNGKQKVLAKGWAPSMSYNPSTDWAQGGPIIERESICLYFNPEDANMFEWHAEDRSHALYLEGPTPLIAAMRCYVASKLGEEVEVPDELV